MPALRKYITLGTMSKLLLDKGCGLCQLVSQIIVFDAGVPIAKHLFSLVKGLRKNPWRRCTHVLLPKFAYTACSTRYTLV